MKNKKRCIDNLHMFSIYTVTMNMRVIYKCTDCGWLTTEPWKKWDSIVDMIMKEEDQAPI